MTIVLCSKCKETKDPFVRGMCKKCYRAEQYTINKRQDSIDGKARYKANPSKRRTAINKSRRTLKAKTIQALGNRCACCGETQQEFLTIDHIQGGGNVHRRAVGGNYGVYRDIEKQGYPRDKYRVLCFNCNCVLQAHEYCPHQTSNTEHMDWWEPVYVSFPIDLEVF